MSLALLALILPVLTLGFRPAGSLGFEGDGWDRWAGKIVAVQPGSPAARAGLEAGDTIVSSSLSSSDRIRLVAPPPGHVFSFDVFDGRAERHVVVTAVPVRPPYTPLQAFLIAAEILTSATFIVIGTVLFILRPGWMTFALYAYCIGTVPLDALGPFYTSAPSWLLTPSFVLARTLFSGFGALPLLPFVLRFPSGSASGWRRRALRPVTLAVLAGLLYYGILAFALATSFVPYYRVLDDVPALAAYVAAIVLLAWGYFERAESDRQRLKIAIWGMALAFVAMIFDYLPGMPAAIYPIANTASIVMPIAIAYAVFKQRVLGIEYFVNRAVVFTALTSGLVVFVGLIEWLTGLFVEEQHLALAVTATAAIVIGIALDKMHDRTERFLERLIFRKRYQSEEYLGRVARALIEANTAQVVHDALGCEPYDELSLTSAAVFAYDAKAAVYRRAYGCGWDERCARELDLDDVLVRTLRADLASLRTRDIRWRRTDIPPEPAAPVLAVPVVLARELLGFTLYGPHTNSTDIDPGEAAILDRLAGAAAVAYTKVAALDREREIQRLYAELSPLARRQAGAT